MPGRLRAEEQPDDAHQDGAREAQGPRLRLLQRRGVRDGQQPEEAHQRGVHLKMKRSRAAK